MLRAASACDTLAHPWPISAQARASSASGQAAGDIFGQNLSGLREGFPGLTTGIGGGSYPVPLNLSALRTPSIGVL